jgi:hypothetical protein
MDVTVLGIVMVDKPGQLPNASFPMDSTPSEMVAEVSPLMENAKLPIDLTLPGITIEVRLLQSQNALLPMDVTLSGMVTDVKVLQFLKTFSPMALTPSGMINEVTNSLSM